MICCYQDSQGGSVRITNYITILFLAVGCGEGVNEPPECEFAASGGATIIGAGGEDYYGTAVFAGDLDGDGRSDVVVGDDQHGEGGSGIGAVYVMESPLGGEVALDSAEAMLVGEREGQAAGRTIAATGDVDGDGLDDFVVGAPRDDTAGEIAGAVYLITSPTSGDLDLSDAAARWLGEAAQDMAGSAVAGAGDVNGDGLADVVVGSQYNGEGGAAYLVSGPGTGITTLSDAGAKLVAEGNADAAGDAVAGAGDVDGDGLADLLVGAPSREWNDVHTAGAAYLVRGPVSGVVDLGDADAILRGEGEGTRAGSAVAGAGDINGDGYDDVLIGAYGLHVDSDHIRDAGAVYVVFGPIEGSLSLPETGTIIEGVQDNEGLGGNLSSGGDLDGDGYADVLIPRGYGSQVMIFRGPLEGTLLVTDADTVLDAPEGAFGVNAATVGDGDGDGLLDVLFNMPAGGAMSGSPWWSGAACVAPGSQL